MSAKCDLRALVPSETCRWPDCQRPARFTNRLIGSVCFHHAKQICECGKRRTLKTVVIHLGGAS